MKFQFSSTRRILALAAFVGTAAAFSGLPAQAQNADIDALRAQIADLQARLDKLAAQQEAQQKTQDAQQKTLDNAKPVVSTKTPIAISGLLQVQAINNFNQGGTSDTRAADTFRLRRGEIRITAPKITDKVSATVMIDPAKNTSSGGPRNNILQEIILSYNLNKTATSSNGVDIGQFKIPVGYESLVSTSALPFVERPLIFTARDPFGGGYGDVRDTGVQLNSKFQDFDVKVGIFNGVGDRQNALALSDAKAYLGRLAYNGVKNLTVGVSGGSGNTGTNSSITGVAGTRRANRTLLNFFAAYNKNKIYAATEYLRGNSVPITSNTNTGGVITPTTFAASRNIQGYYGAAGYSFTPKLQGLFRYDNLNTNRDVSNSTVRDYTLGVNYYVKGNEAKVQFNVVNHSVGSGATGFRKGTELRTAFQASF